MLEKAIIVSLDASILDSGSPSFRRMLNYAEGTGGLVVLVLGIGSKKRVSEKNLVVCGFGGSNKASVFFNAFFGGRKLVKDFGPQAISSQDPFFAGLLAKCLVRKVRVKLIVELHGDFWPEDKKLHPSFFRNLIAEKVLRKANIIRAVSEKVKNGLLNKFSNLKEKKIEVFPIVSETVNSPAFSDNAKPGSKDTITALFVGRLTKEKGLDWFLPVFARVAKENNLFLRIIGNGEERKILEQTVKELGLDSKVNFIGEVPESLLNNEYLTADFLVLPSRQESWGRVVVEAMQNNCPVIVTAETGVAHDLLKNGENALVVPFGDDETMKQVLLKMATSEDLRKKLAEAGKAAVADLSFDKTADKMRDLWKNA